MGSCVSSFDRRKKVNVRTVETFQTNLVHRGSLSTFDEKYEQGKLLGKGITGSVYEVTHRASGRKFAMKSINLDDVDDAQIRELRTEIMILKQLDHPNVVKLFEVYEDESNRSMKLIMELLTGGHLGTRVLNNEADLCRVVKQIVSACRYFHSRGVCHRDIKLENILWCKDQPISSVKIIDFGLGTLFYSAERLLQRQHMLSRRGSFVEEIGDYDSDEDSDSLEQNDCNDGKYSSHHKSMENWAARWSVKRGRSERLSDTWSDKNKSKSRLSSRGVLPGFSEKFEVSDKAYEKSRILRTACGTAYYMPPELVVDTGKGYSGEKMDMWAVGVTTYALIAKRPPFVGKNNRLVFESIRRCEPSYSGEAWKKVSPSAMRFVQCCLVANPSIRYSSEDALRSAWLSEAPQTPRGISITDEYRTRVVKSLREFATISSLKKSAMMIVAHRMYDDKGHSFSACFHEIDTRDNGFIVYEDLIKFIAKVDPTLSRREMRRICKAVDQDRTSAVTYMELLAACLDADELITPEMASMAFNHLDLDQSGIITHSSLTKLLGHGFSNEEISGIIQEVDKSRSGYVSKEEFIQLMLDAPDICSTTSVSSLKYQDSGTAVGSDEEISGENEDNFLEGMNPQLVSVGSP